MLRRTYRETLEKDWNDAVEVLAGDKNQRLWPYILEEPMTKSNDTLLHVVTMHFNHKFFGDFLRLISVEVRRDILSVKNKNGDTALHLAAEIGCIEICKLIVAEERRGGSNNSSRSSLVHIRNHRLETPLFLAALHGYEETFLLLHEHSKQCGASRSSFSGMPWRRERGETMLHCTLERGHFALAYKIIHLYDEEKIVFALDERGTTPLHVLATKHSAFKSSTNFGLWRTLLYHSTSIEPLPPKQPDHSDENRVVDIRLPEDEKQHQEPDLGKKVSTMLKTYMMSVFGHLQREIKKTKKMKYNHVWSSRVMNNIVEKLEANWYFIHGTNPALADPIYEERVERIFSIIKSSDDKKSKTALKKENEANQKKQENEEEENWETMPIILTAAKNGILEMVEGMLSYAPAYIQEYLESVAPPHLIFQYNNKKELPADIFSESHNELMVKAGDWLKSTSESCSVVAALIAGVAYATTSNLPGGTNDNTGKPTLVGQPVFNMFLVASLLALCFSVTALVMFLSILTSRQQPKYYKWELPLKLLLGLSSLFVSIAAMLISFCSAYFFVFKDGMHHMEFIIIYAATCLPVTFYAAAQFPLYWDLIKAIFTNVPQPDHGQS
ncbi:hypothetical protein Ahy_B04g070301 isoform A [Arachis hypogaea]|uniref:PGG domain-containing protein n=1 Tax=Arachis hypogaea TaxID=3818 RepID=A0A444ZG50_ARAHY|nr:hypothetical protein Ahy_B04g070301 isoform A [Arachis hypogaea]